jgi:hypothetical protein
MNRLKRKHKISQQRVTIQFSAFLGGGKGSGCRLLMKIADGGGSLDDSQRHPVVLYVVSPRLAAVFDRFCTCARVSRKNNV